MRNGLGIIDSDAHLQEPFDIWSEFVEAEFYDRRPIPKDHPNKMMLFYGPCELFPEGTHPSPNRPDRVSSSMHEKYGHAWEDYWSNKSRIKDMDTYGWDKMVLITGNAGVGILRQEGQDPALMWALTRAYNNWAHAFASEDPSRLKLTVSLPSQHDIEGIVTEARRGIEQLGAVTTIVPKPLEGTWWHDPYYEPFWALHQELDTPVSFHGVMSGDPHTGTRYKQIYGQFVALEHAMGFAFENMISMGHIIYSGLLERFPTMRFACLEGNAGWLPFWLGRLDDHAVEGRRQAVFFDAPPLKMKPSDYFRRQGFVACDGDEAAVKAAVDLVGDDFVVWNTDYPHPDAPDPDKALDSFLAQPISDAAKKKILWDNPIKLFGKQMVS